MDPEAKQVFLGGACGRTTWRQEIAIPMLRAAGVTYFDPQLRVGEWTEECQAVEMRAKAAAEVLLFVINEETRGVAGIGEAAYSLGAGQPLALVVTDVGAVEIDGRKLSDAERDDLNRGRIFVRSMAKRHGVPVFTDVASAVRHAIGLLQSKPAGLTVERLRAILSDVRFKNGDFLVEEIEGGFLLQLRCEETDPGTGAAQTFYGRKWHVAATSSESDVVRTAFKAAVTWQEHEARETFTYRGAPVFGPHSDMEELIRLSKHAPQ